MSQIIIIDDHVIHTLQYITMFCVLGRLADSLSVAISLTNFDSQVREWSELMALFMKSSLMKKLEKNTKSELLHLLNHYINLKFTVISFFYILFSCVW